jgi:iron complex outermembrane receptor protein
LFLAAVLTLAWAGSARAEDQATEQARQHYESGTRHYDLGHWDDAIADFEKAYEMRPDPSFLYNLAQTYRRKGDPKRALDLYKNFLRKDPKSPQRADVEEKIAVLQKQIDESSSKPAGAPVDPLAPAVATPAPVTGQVLAPTPTAEPAAQPALAPSPVVVGPPPASAPLPLEAAPAAVEESRPASPGRGLRTAGIVSGSVGAASVIAGAIFGLRARSLSNRVADANTFNRSDDSAGQRAETLQWTFYGIGAGALVTGVVLYTLGLRASQTAPATVSLAPVVGPGTAGLSAMGVF